MTLAPAIYLHAGARLIQLGDATAPDGLNVLAQEECGAHAVGHGLVREDQR